MNSILRLMPVALLALLAACRSDSGSTTTQEQQQPPATPPKAAAPASAPRAFYRQYRGLRPGTSDTLVLHLVTAPLPNFNSDLEGFSATYHGTDGHPYQLLSYPARTPDSLLLADISPEIAPGGDAGPNWRLHYQKHALTGTVNGQRIELREASPPGSLAFAVPYYTDSVVAFPGVSRSPVAHLSLQALLPQAAPPTLEANLLRFLRGDTLPALALPALWAQRRAEFQQMYREDAQALRHELEQEAAQDSSDMPFGYALNYARQVATYVYWNKSPLLSIGVFTYSYSGGAHGMYTTEVATYNTRTGQRLRFQDVFRPGTDAQLSRVLDRAVRRTMHIPAGEALDKTLFVEHMPVTHNFYLTGGGAVFVYPPYKIASYAQGEVQVFVPLVELQPLMAAPFT